jgi:hypothetical protein
VTPLDVSTSTITNTEGLPFEERKDIIKQVSKGKIPAGKVKDEVEYRKLKKKVEEKHPELKDETKKFPIQKTPNDLAIVLNQHILALTAYICPQDDVNLKLLEGFAKKITEPHRESLKIQGKMLAIGLQRFVEMLK